MNRISRRSFVGATLATSALPLWSAAGAESAAMPSSPTPSGFTAQLVADVGSIPTRPLPENAIERSRQAVLDWLGVAISGSRQPSARIAVSTLASTTGQTGVPVIGTADRLPVRETALVEGIASHSEELDDMGPGGHPSVALLPAVFALAHSLDASGTAVLHAMLQGYQTMKALQGAMGTQSGARGVHSTGVMGAMGAAIGAGALLGNDAPRQQQALGLAAMQASGITGGFGSMAKHLVAGNAAAAGLTAAMLAHDGFTAPSNIIEVPRGFAHVVNGNMTDFDPNRPGARLGEKLAVEELMFKLHAACGGTHSAIEAIKSARRQKPFSNDDIQEILLKVPKGVPCPVVDEPKTGLEAKFSLYHAAAAALMGDTGPSGFSDAKVSDPDFVRLRRLVKVDRSLPGIEGPTEVVIRLKNGQVRSASVNAIRVRADAELADQRRDLETKFDSLVSPILGAERAKQIMAAARGFERLGSIRELIGLTTVNG